MKARKTEQLAIELRENIEPVVMRAGAEELPQKMKPAVMLTVRLVLGLVVNVARIADALELKATSPQPGAKNDDDVPF